MRNPFTAYLLLAASAFGVAGLHRFYLGKPVSGLLWLMTWGLGGFGTLYDILTLREQTDDFNRRYLPPGPYVARGYLPPAPEDRHQSKPLELRLLGVAKQHKGRLTVMQAAADLGVRTEEVEKKLDELCHQGHATVEVSEDGVLYYDFPELRFS